MSCLEKHAHNRKYSFFVLFSFLIVRVLMNMEGLFSLFVSSSTQGAYSKFELTSIQRMYSNLISITATS